MSSALKITRTFTTAIRSSCCVALIAETTANTETQRHRGVNCSVLCASVPLWSFRCCCCGESESFFESLRHPAPAALLAHVVVVFGAELLQRLEGLRDGDVSEGTQRLAADGVADLGQQVEVLLRAAAGLDAVQDAQHPSRALAAGRALPAGLVFVEVGQLLGHPHHADR